MPFLRIPRPDIVAVLAAAIVVLGTFAFLADRVLTPGIEPVSLAPCPHEDALPPGASACLWDASESGNGRGTDLVLFLHPDTDTVVSVPVPPPDVTETVAGVQVPEHGPQTETLASGTPPVAEMAGAGLALVAVGAGAMVGTRRRGYYPPIRGEHHESGPEWTRTDELFRSTMPVAPVVATPETMRSPLGEHVALRARQALARAMGDHRAVSARPTHDGKRAVIECSCGALFDAPKSLTAVRAHERHAASEAAAYRAE